MAPITEEVISGLKDTINKLEAKVSDLEDRLSNGGKPKSVSEQMRIILMGPPGAGTPSNSRNRKIMQWLLTVSARQGYSSPQP
jgi:adenylate kinase